MATNSVALNVYQINQNVLPLLTGVIRIGFPTGGVLIRDTSGSPNRSLSTGVNVYSAIQMPDGTLYYVSETQAAVIALFNA